MGYFIWHSLAQRGIEVEFIGPLSLPSSVKRVLALKGSYYKKVSQKLYLPEHDVMASKAYSREVWKRLQNLKGIEAIVSPGTIPVAFLPGDLPLITISDATHKLLFETYPAYKNLCAATRRTGDRIERAAMERASASVFASDWAAASAIRDYGASAGKVQVVPLGANFVNQPAREDVVRSVDARDYNEVRLLFIGVEWERKGGPVALQVIRTLVKQGVSARLTIIGCHPVIPLEDAGHVCVRGFIKKDAEGQQEIFNELGRSHFLIVPSEAECYGLVFCEASALGVPSIARNVGGIGTIVKNGFNGRLFELQDTAKDMADWIVSLFREPAAYRRLALSSVAEFESRLNWTVAGKKLEAILRDVIAKAKKI